MGFDGLTIGFYGNDGGEDVVGGWNESPGVGEGGYFGRREGSEDRSVGVETVEMESGQGGRVGENVFFERVVAELWERRREVSVRNEQAPRNENARLGNSSQTTIPQFLRKVGLGLSDLLQVLLEPILSSLRVRNGRVGLVGSSDGML